MSLSVYYGGTFAEQELDALKIRRAKFKEKLWALDLNLKIYDPLRGKALRATSPKDSMEMVYAEGSFTPNEIVHRDLNDLQNSDIVILNMLKPSIGSSCELMFSNLHKKIILVISNNSLVTQHPWVQSLTTKIFETEDEVIDYLHNYLI